MNNSNYTFWELIGKHRIEIPIIQRDYAQGRDNSKSKDIRSTFIKQIKNTLSAKNELHLNFVYGKINGKMDAAKIAENKAAIQGMISAVQAYSKNLDLNIECKIDDKEIMQNENQTSFVPLDGQQRLTTLFLLHWYLIPNIETDGKNVHVKKMKNFSYSVRPSSKDFCTALVQNNFEKCNVKSISDKIKDAQWFFSYWEKDPTVYGMLMMLDEIHDQFKNESKEILDRYWELLTDTEAETKIISFEFLDLAKYNLTDDLYIKMNARGKALTPFENFKAWLMEYISSNENIEINKIDDKDWTLLLDTKWTDLFWKNKDDANMLIDEEYMRFFRNISQIYYVQKDSFKSDNKEHREKATLLATRKGGDQEYLFVPNSFFAEIEILSSNNLNNIFAIIDVLSDQQKDIEKNISDISFFSKEQSLFKAFISNEMTYPDKVRFYGMMLYLLKEKDSFDTVKFSNWMRVVRNLVENSVIDDIAPFSRAIKGLLKLSANCNNIYEYLARPEIENISGFNEIQKNEEIRKAKLICENIDWEEKFLKFENHEYFKGQINFLLDLFSENEIITMTKFCDYAEKCAIIFSQKMKGQNDVTFEQALLAQGNYLISVDSNYSFVRMYTPSGKKAQDWRTTVFRDKTKLILIRKLLDKIKTGNVFDGLKNIINSYNVNDWCKYFINHPETITYCRQRFIRFNHVNDIKLLGSSATSHYHGELYSYAFHLHLNKLISQKELEISPFFNMVKYNPVKSNSQNACAYLDASKFTASHKYAIDISYVNSKFNIKFFNRIENIGINDDIKKILIKNEFCEEANFLSITRDNEQQTKVLITDLCRDLKPQMII